MLLRLVESKESGAEKEFQHLLVKYVFFVVLVFVYAVSSKKVRCPPRAAYFAFYRKKTSVFITQDISDLIIIV